MKKVLYAVWQCTWGILQTLLGFVHFLVYLRCPHFCYHGAVITRWTNKASVSLGLFVFVTDDLPYYERVADTMSRQELADRLLVHEYGHTIQSLLLGPLYLLVIGVPSTVWGFWPSLNRRRQQEQISYFASLRKAGPTHGVKRLQEALPWGRWSSIDRTSGKTGVTNAPVLPDVCLCMGCSPPAQRREIARKDENVLKKMY